MPDREVIKTKAGFMKVPENADKPNEDNEEG
jgi:hypothetical protein